MESPRRCFILPYSLPVGPSPAIQVVSDGVAGNQLRTNRTDSLTLSVFRDSTGFAAALNEDGTVNSPSNPAKNGSSVVLFGTGGGATIPASIAGEVTPLERRPLRSSSGTSIVVLPSGMMLPIEYAGGAPGLVSGVTQINIKL